MSQPPTPRQAAPSDVRRTELVGEVLAGLEALDELPLEEQTARLTEAQLLNRFDPERAMFIAESPKVILRALEGGLNLVDCLLEEDSCGKSCACPSRIVWLKIRDGLNRIVDGITLQDMIDEYACQMAQGEEE